MPLITCRSRVALYNHISGSLIHFFLLFCLMSFCVTYDPTRSLSGEVRSKGWNAVVSGVCFAEEKSMRGGGNLTGREVYAKEIEGIIENIGGLPEVKRERKPRRTRCRTDAITGIALVG